MMEKRKILLIGQLPKEVGGTYTTGIARVVENLYQKDFDGLKTYWYFTNVPDKVAKEKCNYDSQYTGYRMLPLHMIANMLSHPVRTYKEWRHYKEFAGVNPVRFEFYKANFKKIIKEVKPDLIHLHGAGMAPLYFANREFGVPLILTFHGFMYNQEDPNTERYKKSYLGIMNMPDYYTVLNAETKRKAMVLGMPEEKSTTIPNGVDVSHFYYSESEREIMRKSMKVGQDTLVFVTVGAVVDRKGQYDFLLVLEKLGIDYQYWIVGKGPDEERISSFISKYGLEDKVRMLGYVDGRNLYKYHSAADVYAHVSTTEGQALSEIEAFATGLRIIVRKEIAGTVIGDPQHDTDTYHVVNMPDTDLDGLKQWLKYGNKERKSKGKYDWQEIAHLYSNLYHKILQ